MLELIPVVLTILAAAGYGTALARLHRRGDRWPASRTACLVAGSVCVCAAVLPPLGSHDEYFPVHIVQHLLLGMAGPAFLALSAPVTLVLRALTRRPRRAALRLLHSRPVAIVSSLPAALVLDLGGLYVLYLTGLYRAAESNDLIHAAVHLHMFLAGCLLSWALIGLDPIRRRPGIKARLAALVIAGAAHDTLAKLMYAHSLPAGGGSIGQPSYRRRADVLRRHRHRHCTCHCPHGPVVSGERPGPGPHRAPGECRGTPRVWLQAGKRETASACKAERPGRCERVPGLPSDVLSDEGSVPG